MFRWFFGAWMAAMAAMLFLAGCGVATTTGNVAITGTVTLTATSTTADATVTPTLAAGLACPGVSDSQAVGMFAANNIPTPPYTLVKSGTYGASDGVTFSSSYQLFDLCVPLFSPAQASAFYQTAMPAAQWTASPTFPYGNDPHEICRTTCWTRDLGGGQTLGVALEQVTATNGHTTLVLRVASGHSNQ